MAPRLHFLNQNRADSLADTVSNDVTIAEIPTPFLEDYSCMPFNQFTGSEMAKRLSVRIRNNGANQVNIGYKYRIYDKSNNLVFPEYNGGYDNLNPYKPNNFSPPDYGYSNVLAHAFPLVSDTFALMPTDSTDYSIKHFVFLNTGSSTDINLNNDTVIQFQRFRNYFAFDDGSAEAGYYVNGISGKVALKITLNKPDTLRSLRIYFEPAGNIPNISGPTSNYFFSLNVWKEWSTGGPGDLIVKDSTPNKKPIYFNTGFKEIPEYKFSKPLVLNAGTYFIGIQQKVASGISVGFDMNYDHHTSLYFDDGSGWEQSTFKGSLMMHAVFGKEIPAPVGISENSVGNSKIYHVFPNPAKNEFTIRSFEAESNSFQLVNAMGQMVKQGEYEATEYKVSTEELSPGLYFLILQNSKKQIVLQQKLIIQH